MDSTKDWYHSIAAESEGIYREKGSKFIAIAIPVTDEAEVKSVLDNIRKKYFDATHHCYAYRIGFKNQLYRINDDGEPSGSAGKPIYGQILSKELYDLLIVVIRYYGGTKLGVAGLIQAYRTAAQEALSNATVIEKVLMAKYELYFEYPLMNEVMRALKEEGAKITGHLNGDRYGLQAEVRQSRAEALDRKIGRLRGVTLILTT